MWLAASSTTIPMSPRAARHFLHPEWAALGVRWLVLLVMTLGTVISSVGSLTSHGIAAMTDGLHAAAMTSDSSHELAHGHAHEDDESPSATVSPDAAVDHPHHGADHSHDKAHVPPTAWRSVPPQLPGRVGHIRPWNEMVQASRLERPPRG